MRVRTRVDTVYKFDELEEAVQQKVLEKIAGWNIEGYEPSDLTYQFEQRLEECGFPTDDIEWRLSNSQGDGVAFYGSIDVEKFLRSRKEFTKYRRFFGGSHDIEAYISRNSWATHYSHWNTMDVEVRVEAYDRELTVKEEILASELREMLADAVVSMSHKLESQGYEEFEWITSEEYIKEQIEANDYEFTWEGGIA
jgi:hypothetical protein